jgi:hypothetical protein
MSRRNRCLTPPHPRSCQVCDRVPDYCCSAASDMSVPRTASKYALDTRGICPYFHHSFVFLTWRTHYNHRLITKESMQITPWGRVLPEKLTVTQLLRNFPAFYGIRRFITVFTTARHWSLPWARWIQSTPYPSHFPKMNCDTILPSTPQYYKWFFCLKLCMSFHISIECYIACPSHPPWYVAKRKTQCHVVRGCNQKFPDSVDKRNIHL